MLCIAEISGVATGVKGVSTSSPTSSIFMHSVGNLTFVG